MRLFIALDYNDLNGYFVAIQNQIDNPLARLTMVSAFHLTLKFLGEVSDNEVGLITERLRQIQFNPFYLDLSQIGVFPNENYIKVIWVGVTPKNQVVELQTKIEDSLKTFNFKKEFDFHPHITLARVKFVKDKEMFIKHLKSIKLEERGIGINNFRLVKSTLTPEGPVYEDLETFQPISKAF